MQKNLGSTRDTAFMSITEAMGLAATAMEANSPDALLVMTLSGSRENAILGGTLDASKIERLESLLAELKTRDATEGDGDRVLHVWR